MSQSFKLKYDEMRDNNPTDDTAKTDHLVKEFDEFYKEESASRNIAFVWPDGKRLCLNYGYLIHHEYDPNGSQILMTFTSHVVMLKGVNLVDMFYDLMQHIPRQITCTDKRYNIIGPDEKPIVNEIIATLKE